LTGPPPGKCDQGLMQQLTQRAIAAQAHECQPLHLSAEQELSISWLASSGQSEAC